MTISYIFIL